MKSATLKALLKRIETMEVHFEAGLAECSKVREVLIAAATPAAKSKEKPTGLTAAQIRELKGKFRARIERKIA